MNRQKQKMVWLLAFLACLFTEMAGYGQVVPQPDIPPPGPPGGGHRGPALPKKAVVPVSGPPIKMKEEKAESILYRKRRGHILHVEFGPGLPGGELRNRFGLHGHISGGYTMLFKNHWSLGVEAAYGFGRNVRADPLSSLRDAAGDIIAKDGSQAVDDITERVWMLPTLKAGHMFVLSKRKRAIDWEQGLLLQFGGSWLEYQYHINNVSNDISQLDGERIKGYDRLTSGPGGLLEAMYMLEAPRGSYCIFLKGQYFYGATQSRRAYDFNLARATTGTMYASVFTLQAGIAITLFALDENEFFYY